MRTFFRKLLILALTVAAMVVGLLIYGQFSGSRDQPNPSSTSPLPPKQSDLHDIIKRIAPPDNTLEQGQKLEYYRRGSDGQIEREFFAEQFKLISEDQAVLQDVRAVWYLSGGRILTLKAATGLVQIERGPLGRMQPIGGKLSGNVHISVDVESSASQPGIPAQQHSQQLLITTGDLDYDTRSCQLWTDGPVQMRGVDLDADGIGLLLRWREISREIDTLVINQGGELTYRGPIENVSSNSRTSSSTTEQTPPSSAASQPSSPAESTSRLHSYLASFENRVRITYRDQVLENVDRLNVLFDMRLSEAGGNRRQSSQTQSGGASQQGTATNTAPPPPSTMRLTWVGKLTVVPAEHWQQDEQDEYRFQVQAVGQPLRFNSRQMFGSCAKLQAERQTRTVRLFSSPQFPVDLHPADDISIVTEQAYIDLRAGQARLLGAGSVKTAAKTSFTGTPTAATTKPFNLTWAESASLVFQDRDRPRKNNPSAGFDDFIGRLYISQATATGKVQVLTEQFVGQANLLSVKLGPPSSDATEPGQEIQSLEAWNGFSCQLPANNLTVTADSMKASFQRSSSKRGQFLSGIDLAGSALLSQYGTTQDTQSQLQAQRLHIDLVENKSATSAISNSYESSQVIRLMADGEVIGRYLRNRQTQSTLAADRLVYDEKSRITTLYGDPAKLNKGTDWLESKVIQIAEKQRNYVLSTPGAGRIQASFPTTAGDSSSVPLGLTFSEGMEFDGGANTALFKGSASKRVTGAVVHSPNHYSKLDAQSLKLYLSDTDAPEPTGSTGLTNTSEHLASSQTFFEPISGKTLSKMVLTGMAQVRSVQDGPDGKNRLCAVLLESEALTYQAKEKLFAGQGPGRLLLEDYRPSKRRVRDEKQSETQSSELPISSQGVRLQRVGPGQTAFWWNNSCQYDQTKCIANLNGDVHMVAMGYALALPGQPLENDPLASNRHRTELWSQNFAVIFSAPGRTSPSADERSFADLSSIDELQIHQVQASGQASLLSSDVTIEGQKLTYDASTNNIEIDGSARDRASLTYFDTPRGQMVRWTGQNIHFDAAHRQANAPGGKLEILSQ